MKYSETDEIEIAEVYSVLNMLDMNDIIYFNQVTDEIYKYQPFLLSWLLGMRSEMTHEQFDEVSKLIVLIWEILKKRPNVRNTKLNEQVFEKILKRNISLIKYLDGETHEQEKFFVTISDLEHIKSKALLTVVLFRFKNQKSLKEMPWGIKGIALIGIKSLIESLEEIVE